MVMIGCGDEYGVDLLAQFVEHHAVIGEGWWRFDTRAPALQPLLDRGVSILVRIHDGAQDLRVLADHRVEVRHGSSAAADLGAPEFIAFGISGEDVRVS